MTKVWRASKRRATRKAPVDIQDAVELFGRTTLGGHANIVWVGEPVNVWEVRLDLKDNDPRRRGNTKYESVQLHEWLTAEEWSNKDPLNAPRTTSGKPKDGYRSFDLDELGVSGVLEFLQKTSTTSGRGLFSSQEDAVAQSQKNFDTVNDRRKNRLRDDSVHKMLDHRRQVMKIPFLPVGVDLRRET